MHDNQLLAPRSENASMTIAETRQRLRDHMPVTAKWAYLDHAAVAPVTRPAADAVTAWLAQALEEGDPAWLDWTRLVEETRRAAAQMIGAQTDEIAHVLNTTT